MSKPSVHRSGAKRQAHHLGLWAELLTRLVLRLTGHRILAANYRTRVGEVDIIARKHGTIAFVEVKARADLTAAAEAVSARQRRRIQRAAEHFLLQHPALQACDIRFDVALVTGPLRVTLLRDAWRP